MFSTSVRPLSCDCQTQQRLVATQYVPGVAFDTILNPEALVTVFSSIHLTLANMISCLFHSWSKLSKQWAHTVDLNCYSYVVCAVLDRLFPPSILLGMVHFADSGVEIIIAHVLMGRAASVKYNRLVSHTLPLHETRPAWRPMNLASLILASSLPWPLIDVWSFTWHTSMFLHTWPIHTCQCSRYQNSSQNPWWTHDGLHFLM